MLCVLAATYIPKRLTPAELRKFVTYLVVLAHIALVSACDGNLSNPDGSKDYNPKRPPQSKENTQNRDQAAEVSDTIADFAVPADSIKMIEAVTDSSVIGGEEVETDELGTELTNEPDPLDSYEGYEGEGYLDLPKGDGVGRERLLGAFAAKVINPNARNKTDSALYVIEKRLAIIPESSHRTVIIEKWFSPVNFKGYKFNKKKVLLYGVEKDRPVAVYFYLENFYIAFGERLYELDETSAYTPFFAVQDSSLARYLLNYESRL
jgi:hypothetical protein